VVFSVNGGVVASGVDGGTATAGVALPDGGAVLIGNAQSGFYVAQLNANGGLDPAFGSGGVAHVIVDVPTYSQVQQIVRQADGKLVVVVYGRPEDRRQSPSLVLVRLNSDGRPDQSFGVGGVDKLPIYEGCVGCTPLALGRDGGLVVTGKGYAPAVTPSPNVARSQWVVARLTSTGAFDSSFGRAGIVAIATLQGTASVGYDAIALNDGDLVTLGGGVLAGGSRSLLTRLLPSGAADPTFNNGAPAPLPGEHGSAIVAYPDGSIAAALGGALARYTSAGVLDSTFGRNGVAQIGSVDHYFQLLPGASGSLIVVIQSQSAPLKQQVERITSDGTMDPTLGGSNGVLLQTPFGGGAASPRVTDRSERCRRWRRTASATASSCNARTAPICSSAASRYPSSPALGYREIRSSTSQWPPSHRPLRPKRPTAGPRQPCTCGSGCRRRKPRPRSAGTAFASR